MRKIAATIMIAVVVNMLGCSSTPVDRNTAQETNGRISTEYAQYSESKPHQVVVVHDNLFGPAIVRPKVFANGALLGTLGQGEKLTFFVSSGLLQLGWSAITEGNYREQEFVISAETKNVFHLVTPAGDVLRFVREK